MAIAYSDPDWTLVHSRYLKESIELQGRLGMRKEELLSTLTLLRLGLNGKSAAWAIKTSQQSSAEDASTLVRSVIKLAGSLDKGNVLHVSKALLIHAHRLCGDRLSCFRLSDGWEVHLYT